jgi:hypothetical protein
MDWAKPESENLADAGNRRYYGLCGHLAARTVI